MVRLAVAGAALALGVAAVPAPILAQSRSGETCQPSAAREQRRSVLGGLAGGLIGRALGSTSVSRTIGSWVPAQTMLTDAFLNLLDCDEQQKAVQATEQATRQAETQGAGSRAAWRSDSRPGVTGTSTVTAVDAPETSGRRCMTVVDVVIIDGEETSQPKRMCRTPPSARYVRV